MKLGCKSHSHLRASASRVGLAVKSQIKCDFKASSHMTARLPKVGRLVGSQKEEQQKEGDSQLGVQGRGARASERGRGSNRLEQPGGG